MFENSWGFANCVGLGNFVCSYTENEQVSKDRDCKLSIDG